MLRRLRAESGMTLVELLLVMVLSLLLAGAALTLLTSFQRQAAADIERAHVIREAESGLARMTRELREAYAVTSRGADQIAVQLRINGTAVAVRYSCAEPYLSLAGVFRCVRFATQAGVTRTNVVIDRVLNAAPSTPAGERVFQYPNGRPSYVRAQVAVPARGDRRVSSFDYRVVLDDGFYMRNCDATC